MKPSEILDKAADEVERRGWWQGGFVPKGTHPFDLGDCPVCVLGAINVACGGYPHGPVSESAAAAGRALAARLGIAADLVELPLATVVGDEWNDRVAASDEQVVAELRAAAADEREAGR